VTIFMKYALRKTAQVFSAGNNATFAVLILFFGLSLALNVWLGFLVRSSGLSEGHPQTALSSSEEATIGGKPELSHLIDLNGRVVKIDASKTTLIYYFSPTCAWCKLNLPGIISFAKQLELRSNYQILGMTQNSKGVKEYLTQHPLPFPVVVDNDPYDISTMDLRGTPQTVELYKGEVVHNWSGAYQLKVKDSIQRHLDVSLPDLFSGGELVEVH
jgi:hypothetical protein